MMKFPICGKIKFMFQTNNQNGKAVSGEFQAVGVDIQ